MQIEPALIPLMSRSCSTQGSIGRVSYRIARLALLTFAAGTTAVRAEVIQRNDGSQWVGGIDGGAWVSCSPDSVQVVESAAKLTCFVCRIRVDSLFNPMTISSYCTEDRVDNHWRRLAGSDSSNSRTGLQFADSFRIEMKDGVMLNAHWLALTWMGAREVQGWYSWKIGAWRDEVKFKVPLPWMERNVDYLDFALSFIGLGAKQPNRGSCRQLLAKDEHASGMECALCSFPNVDQQVDQQNVIIGVFCAGADDVADMSASQLDCARLSGLELSPSRMSVSTCDGLLAIHPKGPVYRLYENNHSEAIYLPASK